MSPVVQPELVVLGRERLVNLAVLGAPIISKPDIKAGIIELKGQGNTVQVGPEPGGCVTSKPMLDENGRLSGLARHNCPIIGDLTSYMECSQGVSVFSLHLDGFPSVAMPLHDR